MVEPCGPRSAAFQVITFCVWETVTWLIVGPLSVKVPLYCVTAPSPSVVEMT